VAYHSIKQRIAKNTSHVSAATYNTEQEGIDSSYMTSIGSYTGKRTEKAATNSDNQLKWQ
jgi:hypothetical protein